MRAEPIPEGFVATLVSDLLGARQHCHGAGPAWPGHRDGRAWAFDLSADAGAGGPAGSDVCFRSKNCCRALRRGQPARQIDEREPRPHRGGADRSDEAKGDAHQHGAGGPYVDTKALVDALNSGHLGGAGIDVFDDEPIPAGHALLACQQVVLTPHNANQTPEGIELLNAGVVDNVIAFLQGRPRNRVV